MCIRDSLCACALGRLCARALVRLSACAHVRLCACALVRACVREANDARERAACISVLAQRSRGAALFRAERQRYGTLQGRAPATWH
eukprot:1332462-Alexandrium_andersonii.AAC.1